MLQGKQAGVSGGRGVLVIRGKNACSFCRGDVKTIARALDLDSLTVIDDDGRVLYFLDSDALRPVSEGGKGWQP
jgi:hypothetical protein